MIDIKGVNKAQLLLCLHAAAVPVALPNGQYDPMSLLQLQPEDAMNIVDQMEGSLVFTNINGRVLNIDLTGDEFDETAYNKANGSNMAYLAIQHLLK